MGWTLGVLRGYPQKRLRACVAVHLLGCISHTRGGARHGTGALGKLAPPEGYSTSIHVGLLSCNPSLRVRRRSDARAEALAGALADTADDTLTDAFAHEQNARTGDRRAGRCSVGYELP
jgi:hypothetical protein